MKKTILGLTIAALSTGAFAADDKWYMGANYLHTKAKQNDVVRTNEMDASLTNFSKESGYSLNAGKSLVITDSLALAFEFEYLHFGEFVGDIDIDVENMDILVPVTMDMSAYSVNVRPKYYITDKFYLGAIAGATRYTGKLNALEASSSSSEIGYNVGLEAGIDITPHFALHTGYRRFGVNFDEGNGADDTKIDMDTLYAGVTYKF